MTKITYESDHGSRLVYDVTLRKGAVMSADEKYRYLLMRHLKGYTGKMKDERPIAFVMLNPSTADHKVDDPTIKRCINFAERWGFNKLVVVNLYAYRATKPQEMLNAPDPIGEDNNHWLQHVLMFCDEVVCAWGAKAGMKEVSEFIRMAHERGRVLSHVGLTKHGMPRHPLYVKADVDLDIYTMRGIKHG